MAPQYRNKEATICVINIRELQYFLHCKHVTRHTFPQRQFRVFIPLVQAEKHHSFNMKQDKKNEWGISSLKVTWSSRVCMGTCNQKSGSIFVSLCKNIPAGKAKRKQSLIQTFYETSAAHCLIDWHLPNQPTKITSFACFSSMQIFHAWKKCRLVDLKNSFYLLIFFT